MMWIIFPKSRKITEMKSEIFFVKSLESYFEKFIQSIIRNPDSLKSGRKFTNIKLTPRETLGAFLICAVVKFISKQDWTLARDTDYGDGILIQLKKNRRYSKAISLEQVYVRLRPKVFSRTDIAESINRELLKKVNKGKEYAKNRHLIIFLDVEGELDVAVIKNYVKNISDRFDSYWLFAPTDGIDYLVFLLRAKRDQPAIYKVLLSKSFRRWTVEKIGRI